MLPMERAPGVAAGVPRAVKATIDGDGAAEAKAEAASVKAVPPAFERGEPAALARQSYSAVGQRPWQGKVTYSARTNGNLPII